MRSLRTRTFFHFRSVAAVALTAAVTFTMGLSASAQDTSSGNDFYTVPDGDVAELSTFIEKVRSYQPESVLEVFQHRKKAGPAIKEAAERILKLEKDKTSKEYALAERLILLVDIQELSAATPERQARTYEAVRKYVQGRTESELAFSMAYQTATGLEFGGADELAAKAYLEFGETFADAQDGAYKDIASKMVGAARRLKLEGQPIQVTGTYLDGEEFDWKAYRGKVVLLDFWATWCEECVVAMPRLKAVYDRYHDQGLEIVGISVDADRQALEAFLAEAELPWVILDHNDGEDGHPTADRYGIISLPKMILVDREGKVVSNDAVGELDRLLEAQFKAEDSPAAGRSSE